MENFHPVPKCKIVSESKHLIMLLSTNNFLFQIDTRKDKDIDKGNLFLLVIPEKFEPIIFNTYHDSLLAGHQGPYRTAMTIRQNFFIHNLMNKVKEIHRSLSHLLKDEADIHEK